MRQLMGAFNTSFVLCSKEIKITVESTSIAVATCAESVDERAGFRLSTVAAVDLYRWVLRISIVAYQNDIAVEASMDAEGMPLEQERRFHCRGLQELSQHHSAKLGPRIVLCLAHLRHAQDSNRGY